MMKIRVVLSMERINLLFKLKPHCVQLCNTMPHLTPPPTPQKEKKKLIKAKEILQAPRGPLFFLDTCTLYLNPLNKLEANFK